MKNNFKIFILSVLLSIFPLKLPAAEQSPPLIDSNAVISMDFQDAALKDVVKIFSIQSGLNFIASEGVQDRRVTLFLDKIPVREAMDKLFKANNLTFELEPDSKIFIVKDWGKPTAETITKVFYLKYATVSSSSLLQEISSHMASGGGGSSSGGGGSGGRGSAESDTGITKVVKKNLSTNGSLTEDYRTNSLIITDVPSRMPLIEQIILSLDVPAPQVMLEVEMLDVSKNLVDKLGFDYSSNPFTLILHGGARSKFFLGDVLLRGKTDINSTTAGSVVGRSFGELLDFLSTRTDTKFLARPRLLTLNNETAEIRIATSESIGVTTTTEATTGTTSAEPERADTGVLLRITPQVNMDTGEITMFIYPQVSQATTGNTLTSAGQSFIYRDPEIRSTKSCVRVKDNQTVVIGGLIRNELSEQVKKIPILGDIPVIGTLFRHKDKTIDKERELLVFITPHIIKDINTEFAQARKTSLLAKEQVSVPASQRHSAIEASLNNFEKTK